MKIKGSLLGVLFLLSSGFVTPAHAQISCLQYLAKTQNHYDFTSQTNFRRSYKTINSIGQAIDFIKQAAKSTELEHHSYRQEIPGFEKSLGRYLSHLNINELSKLLLAIAKPKGFHIEDHTLKVVDESFVLRQNSLKPKDIPQILRTFEDLMLRPSETSLKMFEAKIISEIDRFNANNLSKVLKSFGRFEYTPSKQFMELWFSEAQKKINTFDANNLSGVLFSLYLMRSWESIEKFVHLLPLESWQAVQASTTRINQSQISLVSMYMDVVLGKQLPELRFFRDDFKNNVQTPNSGSWLEFEVQMYLTSKKLEYIQEFQTTPGFYVDFFIPSQNKILQIDGKQHYLKSVDNEGKIIYKLRPQDKNIDDILKASGYEVERLSMEDVKNL